MERVEARLGDTADSVKIKSGGAVYNTDQEIITLLDNVVVTSNDFVLKTDVMRYLIKFRKAKSAAAVQAVGRDMKISGNSFMYDLNNGGFRVGSRVHFELL
jgi:lipopolysaccharide export system protein LptA